ncbi:MAG: cytochrome C peroxidase [Gemmataceae bacterium]|nr:cytochrome C peroxidase [Gemmataceae bacterium]
MNISRFGLVILASALAWPLAAHSDDRSDLDAQTPDPRLLLPFEKQQAIRFVAAETSHEEWHKLPAFWNAGTEEATDPETNRKVTRSVVRIKVPLGLSAPPVPDDNPLTVARWELGKALFFDPVLSADGTVSCASCHDPKTGFTTPTRVSTGIKGRQGNFNAPTLVNVAYQRFHFWDGRADALEMQAQGPVENPREMSDDDGDAWPRAVQRVRRGGTYRERFQAAFGTEATRDTIAKALAGFQRTILSGNSLHDRAVLIAKKRGVSPKDREPIAPVLRDYREAIEDAVQRQDTPALSALMGAQLAEIEISGPEVRLLAESLANGRKIFFGRGGCHECHRGERFTDDGFHNLGVGVVEGKLPAGFEGRIKSLPVGRKDAALTGAFKTPGLRGLVHSGPYMHDGSLDSLEKVIDFYNSRGEANEFLDLRRRDREAEAALLLSVRQKIQDRLPENLLFGKEQKLVIPLRLSLGDRLQRDLVLFLRSLQGDPVDALVADPKTALR